MELCQPQQQIVNLAYQRREREPNCRIQVVKTYWLRWIYYRIGVTKQEKLDFDVVLFVSGLNLFMLCWSLCLYLNFMNIIPSLPHALHCFLEISILESWHVRCSNGFKRRDIWVPNTSPRTWPRFQEYSKSLKNAYSSKLTIEYNFSTSTYSWIKFCNINQNIAAPLLDIVWFFACVYCSDNYYIPKCCK